MGVWVAVLLKPATVLQRIRIPSSARAVLEIQCVQKFFILTHIHTNCVCVRVRMHILVGARILSLPDGCPTVSSPVHAAFDLSAKSLQVLEQRNMRGGSTRATCAPFLVIFVGFREGSDLMVFILFGYLLI